VLSYCYWLARLQALSYPIVSRRANVSIYVCLSVYVSATLMLNNLSWKLISHLGVRVE